MAVGIQHVQASQLIEISPPSTGGMAILKDKKNGRTLTLNVVHGPAAGQSKPMQIKKPVHICHHVYEIHGEVDSMSSISEEIQKIKEAKKKWEDSTLRKNMEQLRLKTSPVEVYSPADLENHNFIENVGFPGEYPFTAGRFAIPILNVMWGRGKALGAGKAAKHSYAYAGYGAAEDMRDYYIERGKTPARGGGPNIAFDLPTQIGYDSDHELAEGEVGKVGVAVDTLKDFETIYEAFTGDMDLDRISSSWTINAPANVIIAMYVAMAQKRNIPLEKLRATPQNDILKEFVARGTQIFPIKPSMRMVRDTFTYCTKFLPNMNTISISGYHMREAGATRVQTIAFTFSNAIAYFETAIKAGLDVDQFAGKMSFLNFGGGMEVLKEAASRRAARRVWAKIMRDRFRSKNPSNWAIKELGGGLIGASSCTKQRPINNLVRAVLGAAFSALIGEPPLVHPPFDEPLGLGHSKEATQLSADATRIIIEECNLCDVLDPLAGSYYVESLTNQYEKEIFDILSRVDEMGGAVNAIESGWMKGEVMRSAGEFQRKIELGDIVSVGVNKYADPDELEIMISRTSPYKTERKEDAEKRQIANLHALKKARNNAKVQTCLDKIKNAAEDENENLIPFFVDAVKEYVSIGEICGVLRDVFGEAL
jgi:methylmalonyl-CoA mutase N-terminal domain/subunit